MSNHIFLTGFMGCGKSYWARLLASAFKRPFIDLDEQIASWQQKSISEIFAGAGEPDFRLIERDCLRELKQVPAAIVATGGGTPCFFDNMDWMKKHGKVIYLKTPVPVLLQRLKAQDISRPLVAGLQDIELRDFIEKLLAEREPFYLQADVVAEYDPETEGAFLKQCVEECINGTSVE